jgi:hypothetical protein
MYLLHYFAIFLTSIVALLFSQITILGKRSIPGWLKNYSASEPDPYYRNMTSFIRIARKLMMDWLIM